jgi:hypothetical protein
MAIQAGLAKTQRPYLKNKAKNAGDIFVSQKFLSIK